MNRTMVRRAFCVKVAFSLLLLPQNLTSAAGDQTFIVEKPSRPVFGTVYIDAMPEKYLQLANDFDSLRKLPGYLAIQRFSNPPQPSDLREVIQSK